MLDIRSAVKLQDGDLSVRRLTGRPLQVLERPDGPRVSC
jgi:hypothetical protein